MLAEKHLKKKGYRILDRNYRSPFGEIDIVAMDKDGTVVFVEVKLRSKSSLESPGEAVTKGKMKKLVKTSLLYLQEKGLLNTNVRYDVVGITENGIDHIEEAFNVWEE